MICSCGNPECKVGVTIKAKDDRLKAVIQENTRLRTKLIEWQEKVRKLENLLKDAEE